MAFYLKRNDTTPAIRATLKDGDGNVINLADATVRFHMRAIDSATAAVDAAGSVVSPAANGVVEYAWDAADTTTAGMYSAEFEVTYSDGSIETFPNSDYIRVEIVDDIA